MVSVARSGGNQIAVGCARVGGEEVQTECEGYLFDSFGCKAVKRGKTATTRSGRWEARIMSGWEAWDVSVQGEENERGRAG